MNPDNGKTELRDRYCIALRLDDTLVMDGIVPSIRLTKW
jgi:hypothetical protein